MARGVGAAFGPARRPSVLHRTRGAPRLGAAATDRGGARVTPTEPAPGHVDRLGGLAKLHRGAGQLLTGFLNRLRSPLSLGTRLVAFDDAGRVFLVRHSYLPGLHFPGGAIDDGETCREAVRREAMEEGGLELDTPPELFHVYRSAGSPGRDHVVLFVARGVRQPRPKPPSLEIVASGFHAPDALPEAVTSGSRRRLEEILGGRPPADTW